MNRHQHHENPIFHLDLATPAGTVLRIAAPLFISGLVVFLIFAWFEREIRHANMEQSTRRFRRLERRSHVQATQLHNLEDRQQRLEDEVPGSYHDLRGRIRNLHTGLIHWLASIADRFEELEEGQQRVEERQHVIDEHNLPSLEMGLQRSFADLASFDIHTNDRIQALDERLLHLGQNVEFRLLHAGSHTLEVIQWRTIEYVVDEHVRGQVQALWDGHQILETRLRQLEGRQQRHEHRWRNGTRLENERLRTLTQIQLDTLRLERQAQKLELERKELRTDIFQSIGDWRKEIDEDVRSNMCRCNRNNDRSTSATPASSRDASRGGASGGEELRWQRREEGESSSARNSWLRLPRSLRWRGNQPNARQDPPPAAPFPPEIFGSRRSSLQSFTESLRPRSPTPSVVNRIFSTQERSRQVLERAEPTFEQFRQGNRPVIQEDEDDDSLRRFAWIPAALEELDNNGEPDSPPEYSPHATQPYPYNLDGASEHPGPWLVPGSTLPSSSSSSSQGEQPALSSGSHRSSPRPPPSHDSISGLPLTPDEVRRELNLREWLMYLAAVPQPSTDNHLSHSLITLQHESEPQRLRAIRLRLLTYFHAHDSSIRWPDPERPGHFIHVRQIPGAGGQVQWTQEPLTPSPPTHITHGQSQNETDLSDFRTFWDQRRAERLARSSRSTQSEQIFARLPTTWTAHPSSDPNSLTNDRSLYIADTDGVRCPVHQHLGPHRCEHAPTWASSSPSPSSLLYPSSSDSSYVRIPHHEQCSTSTLVDPFIDPPTLIEPLSSSPDPFSAPRTERFGNENALNMSSSNSSLSSFVTARTSQFDSDHDYRSYLRSRSRLRKPREFMCNETREVSEWMYLK